MSSVLETMLEVFEGALWLAPEVVDDVTTKSPSHMAARAMPKHQAAHEIAQAWGGEVLNEVTHSHFLSSIHEMAEKLELGYKPLVVATDTVPISRKALHHLPYAGALPDTGTVVISKSLLKATNDATTRNMSSGMKAIMAHELSHLKYDKANLLVQKVSPILLPAAAMAALCYYDRATKNKNASNLLDARNDIHEMADEHVAMLDAQDNKPKIESNVHKPLANIARYAAVGMVGLAAALMLNRHISISRELRADRVAVELTQDPEALINVLKKLTSEQKSFYLGLMQNSQEMEKLKPKTFNDAIQAVREMVSHQTTFAYPAFGDRLERIGSYAKQIGIENAAKSFPKPGL